MKQVDIKIVTMYQTVLNYFLKPDKSYQPNLTEFPVNNKIIIALCKEVIGKLKKDPMVIKIKAGVKIFGSIHGQYNDLI